MTIAWFRARPLPPPGSLDETAPIISQLRRRHAIKVITAADADDFVWQNHHARVDLCVYELENEPPAAFMWAYLFRFPGVLITSGASVHNARAAMLQQLARHADYRAEFIFNEGHPPPVRDKVLPRGSWPMLRAPIAASRLTVVRHAVVAERLRDEFPAAHITHVPLGTDAPAATRPPEDARHRSVFRCAVYGDGRQAVAERAAARTAATPPIEIVAGGGDSARLEGADAVLAMTWPPDGESLLPALAGMAAARPVVVFETEFTAGWPTVNPQNWQVRGVSGEPAIAIAIDPRDEEHSLRLALKRLESDATLARRLAAAGHEWWSRHASLAGSVAAWEQVIEEAVALPPPRYPADWPPHLSADGMDQARVILQAFGVRVDF